LADGLEGIMNEVFTEDAAAAAAPAEAPVTDSAPAGEAAAPPADAGAPAVDTPFRWDNVPPELEPLAKGFQADYTRKAQELAEQRKALEAQQQQIAAWQNLNQWAAEDPANAAAWLRQQADLLARQVQAGETETDPYAAIAPQTEVEEALLAQVKALAQEQKQLSQWHREQQLRQQQEQISAEYTALSRQIGRELTQEEQNSIAAFAVQHNIPSVTFAYKAMRYEADLEAARRAGMNAGASVVQSKQAAGPAPAGLADRSGAVADTPKDLNSLTAAVASELGI
jgi:hypothetical protein